MIRWVLFAVAGLIVIVLVVYGVGLVLPEDHTATLSRELSIPVADVWGRVTDLDDHARWRPDVDSVVWIERPPNVLPAWREYGRTGVLTMEATVAEPLDRLVLEIIDEGLPFGGSWTYEFEPTESGTRLTITEDGEIYHPIFRFVAKFALGYDRTMKAYLDALEADIEAGGQP